MQKIFLLIPIIFFAGAILFSGGSVVGINALPPPLNPPPACPAGAICIPNPLQAQTIEDVIEAIINFIFYLALAIVPLMAIIGAFYFLTSAGDSAKINKARDIFLYTAIGFVVILMSKGLIAIIKQVLG